MALSKYNKKRNFEVTNEPKGVTKKTKLKRFVIQYHQARKNHYDFRLEHNGVLISWAIPKGLSENTKDKRLAVHVEDHPIDYINFEGTIPKGNYGAGAVDIYDFGEYYPINNLTKGLKDGNIKVYLSGKKYKGIWKFIKMDEKNWLAIKSNESEPKIDKNKQNIPFKTCSVMLATLTKEVPKGKDWIFEIKYDGYRIVAFKDSNKINLQSRNKIDYTNKFTNIVNSLKKIEQNFIIDGEIVCFDKNGKSDFGLLQKKLKSNSKSSFYFVIFDLLALNGDDLRDLPLHQRKEKLKRLLHKSDCSLIFSEHVTDGQACFNFAKENSLEGIVAKNINSKYISKRSEDWLKIKCYLRQEFIIIGYTKTEKNSVLSAILLGYYKNEELTYVGKVGTGFDSIEKNNLVSEFKKYIRKTCPLKNKISDDNIIWLQPKLVAEIQFAELTQDKLLRQPSFIGLRSDKKANEVFLEVKNE